MVTIENIKQDQCRWHIGKDNEGIAIFCGDPVDKNEGWVQRNNPPCYCLIHAKLAYNYHRKIITK